MRAPRRWFKIGSLLLLASTLLACQRNGETVEEQSSTEPEPTPKIARSNPIPPSDVLIPAPLGTIEDSFEGAIERSTVFLIGEDHVNLESQRRVADLLAYLRNAYDIRVVCSEGTDKPLEVARPNVVQAALRETAEADLAGRQISGLEFFALVYPDVRVVGVENMEAYETHKTALKSSPELDAWSQSFQAFLEEDVQALPEGKVQLVDKALETLKSTGSLEGYFDEMRTILGSDSAEGAELEKLIAAWKLATEQDEQRNRPMMVRRDQALAQGAVDAALGEPVALVVGSFHLEGITRRFKAADQPYVSIQTIGSDSSSSSEDAEAYRRLLEGKPDPLEEWLSHVKPTPALQRETKHQEVAFLGALFHANQLLREGGAIDQVRTALSGVVSNLEIIDSYPISGGYGFDFKVNGKAGHAYFSSQPLQPLTAEAFSGRLEKGKANGIYYGVFDGGSGGGPPIIPHLPAAGSGGEGPFNKRLFVALDEQRRKNPTAVTATLILEKGGALVLLVGNRRRPLSVSREELKHLVEAYLAAEEGPDVLLAAQKLSAALLTGIDQDLPANAQSLYLISQNDLLHDISLPQIAALAKEPGTARFAGLEEVFVLPWKKAQSDLGPLSQERSPVELGKTVFWISEGLEKDAQHAEAIAAIRATGVRINEPLRPGDTVVLLGTGERAWSARLTNGKIVSAKASVLRDADAVVSLGVDMARESGVDVLAVQEMEGDQAVSFGRELAERIRKGSGEESLERLMRRKSAERSKDAHDLARRSLAAKFSAVERAQQRVDRRATSL